jgi:hypothetical protein
MAAVLHKESYVPSHSHNGMDSEATAELAVKTAKILYYKSGN